MNLKNKILLCFTIASLVSFNVHADAGSDALKKLNETNIFFDDFASSLNNTLPSAVTQQNVYSDAWIGKLIPSIPPHFSLGIEAGVTRLDSSALNKAAKNFNVSAIPDNLVFPTIALNGRIGGFVLPFDIGFSFLTFNANDLKNLVPGLGFKYFSIGGDLRYAILQGNGALPKLSVGAGFYHTSGSLTYKRGDVDLGFDFSTNAFVGSVQLSKTFIFVTPFVGFRGIFSDSKTDWNWTIASSLMSEVGIASPSGKGSASRQFGDSFVPQVYGGLGITLAMFNIDLNAGWDFKNQLWTCGMSFRFKL